MQQVELNSAIDLNRIITGKYLLVCGLSYYRTLPIISELKKTNLTFARFSDYNSNPTYESVVRGVEVYRKENCTAIVAVGGGSAIDVAKCIKLFLEMNTGDNYLRQSAVHLKTPLVVVPTTAGTGSEATRYAVIYYNGEKQSICHEELIPNYVIFDSLLLDFLPEYPKKSALLDALCHSIESWWSIHSTSESKSYSKEALRIITTNWKEYIDDKHSLTVNKEMLYAANLAGKAINITATTAPHAMSYKLTSNYGISHGHAVALVLPIVWRYMSCHVDKCIDKRGNEYFEETLQEISQVLDVNGFDEILMRFEMDKYKNIPAIEGIEELVDTVNLLRLSNNPVVLDKTSLTEIYSELSKQIAEKG
ncbi:MAG: phosphonoacetaldehyde reductase [Butyrivibrio sp.]|nr:phosphonoacetaldehyde reductase [Butyrivibrio sp.]